MSNSWIRQFSANRSARHEQIDEHAERAHTEIKLLTDDALRQIKRLAEFPTRSAGQKKRRQEEKAARFARHQKRHLQIKEKTK